jgi:hypothetical protein
VFNRIPKRTIQELIAANICLLLAQIDSLLQDYIFAIGILILVWAATGSWVRIAFDYIQKSLIYKRLLAYTKYLGWQLFYKSRQVLQAIKSSFIKATHIVDQTASTTPRQIITALHKIFQRSTQQSLPRQHEETMQVEIYQSEEKIPGFWNNMIATADSPGWLMLILFELLLITFFYFSLQRFLDAHIGFEMFMVWNDF